MRWTESQLDQAIYDRLPSHNLRWAFLNDRFREVGRTDKSREYDVTLRHGSTCRVTVWLPAGPWDHPKIGVQHGKNADRSHDRV